ETMTRFKLDEVIIDPHDLTSPVEFGLGIDKAQWEYGAFLDSATEAEIWKYVSLLQAKLDHASDPRLSLQDRQSFLIRHAKSKCSGADGDKASLESDRLLTVFDAIANDKLSFLSTNTDSKTMQGMKDHKKKLKGLEKSKKKEDKANFPDETKRER